ncbi:MAG: EscU/YscU/HrcU family type III secretion system export apparatus switch protein, partial [Saccharofermentans sp.]|nr:EscU/YscU/HrcU family type III secretion system export apparatus switch protein [Saccharofermentans sp.]
MIKDCYSINYRLELNLQFFAEGEGGEKTEAATPKKLEDARKEGQVAKSKEVANGLGLIALFLVLKFWVSGLGKQFLGLFPKIYNRIPEVAGLYGGTSPIKDVSVLMTNAFLSIGIMIAPFLIVAFIVAFISDLVQVKWKPTTKPLQPKFNKLNPVNGFKRIFSLNSLIELLKSILKIVIIGGV